MRFFIFLFIPFVYSYIPITAVKQIERKLLYNCSKYNNNLQKLYIDAQEVSKTPFTSLTEKSRNASEANCAEHVKIINKYCYQLATNNYNPITITDINKFLFKSKWRIIYGSPNNKYKVYEFFENDIVKQLFKNYNSSKEYFIKFFILRVNAKTITYVPINKEDIPKSINYLSNYKNYYDIIYLTKFIQIRKNYKNEYIILIKSI
jgi:hypothetical protein